MNFFRGDSLTSVRAAHQKRIDDLSLDEARSVVRALQIRLGELEKSAVNYGAVVARTNDGLSMVGIQGMFHVSEPAHFKVPVPSLVTLNEQGQILAVVENVPGYGNVGRVVSIEDNGAHVVLGPGTPERVLLFAGDPPNVGDRVLMDHTGTILVKNLGKTDAKELVVAEETGVEWDDIGGQDDAKRQLQESIVEPIIHRELYAAYGKAPTKGVLLWGPPGCGKTMLVKAVVTAISKLHGKSPLSSGFISVRGPEILNKFVGASEEGMRGLFVRAREHFAAHGYPAVIAIDEADALLGMRGRQGIEGMEKTIVPQFLADMDGVDASRMRAIVILLTNRPDVLDPAVVRDGRVDRKIEVKRPTAEHAEAIIRAALSKRHLAATSSELATVARVALFNDREALFIIRRKDPTQDRRITAGDFVTGATCAGIVEKATQLALRRDIDAGATSPSGITIDDIVAAVHANRVELLGTDHSVELRDICMQYPQGDVTGLERTHRPAS